MTERETLERASLLVDNRSKEVASAGLADTAASHRSDAAALRTLAAEIEGLRRDAERYRWFRSCDDLPFNAMALDMLGAKLDAAIDRAISGRKG